MSEVLCAEGVDRSRARISLAASLERYSKHRWPNHSRRRGKEGLALRLVSSVTERPGHGLSGTVGDLFVESTGRKQVSHRSARIVSSFRPTQRAWSGILPSMARYAATLRFSTSRGVKAARSCPLCARNIKSPASFCFQAETAKRRCVPRRRSGHR